MFIFQNSQSEQKSASKNEHRKKTIEKKQTISLNVLGKICIAFVNIL